MTTSKLGEAKAFYCDHFGFKTTFEAENYLGLVSEDGTCELSFMPTMGCGPSAEAAGLTLCLEVEDVDAEYARLGKEGVAFVEGPRDNPWGDRSAIAVDPIGVSVYIYKVITPSPEYAKHFKE
jgi:uncharacterized glyoxalase superfamily protein PhnB